MRIEVLHPWARHKYLGRLLCLDPAARVQIRCKLAWKKFHQCRSWLTNSHISLKQRVKYLDSVVRPCAIFGLHVLPMSLKHLHQIATMQRKMLRLVVGWRRLPDESWSDTMRNMRNRVRRAITSSSTSSWDHAVLKQQLHYVSHVIYGKAEWPQLISRWCSDGIRNVGRPRLR